MLYTLDINECLSLPCEQTCNNTLGSFVCSCDDGFVLDNNGISCLGLFPLIWHNTIIIYSYVHDYYRCSYRIFGYSVSHKKACT